MSIRSVTEKTVLMFCGCLIGLLIIECTIRLLGFHPMVTNQWQLDSELGWTFTPNQSWDMQIDGKTINITINASGFRSPEFTVKKPEGVRRIVVIGDSFTEAMQVNFEETFHQRLGSLLTERTGDTWEVIPMGMGGWGTAQEFLALIRYGLAYDPDLVILQFFAFNDICDNTPAAVPFCLYSPPQRPYLVQKDGKWKRMYLHPIRSALRNTSRAFAMLEQFAMLGYINYISGYPSDFTIEHVLQYNRERVKNSIERNGIPMPGIWLVFALQEDQAPQISEGWSLTESLIARMAEELRRLDIPFIVFSAPSEDSIDAANWKRLHEEEKSPLKLQRNEADRRLQEILSHYHIPSVMMLPVFEQNKEAVLPYIDDHFNPKGHILAAEALYTELQSQGFLQSR